MVKADPLDESPEVPSDGLFDAAPAPAPLAVATTVERAFELARSGACVTIEQIADQLRAERHEAVDAQLFDSEIRKALRQACAEARQGYARAQGIGTASII